LLDKKTGGFQRGELIILAGRPGMGKTALSIASAYKSATGGEPSLFFSLEMIGKRLANRAASFACYDGPLDRVPYFAIEAGTVTDKQAHRFADAIRDLWDVELEIEQQSGLSVSQIAARARRHKQRLAQRGLTLGTVWIDHLGLIKPSANYKGNRVNELAEVSGALKVLAKDLDVPIVALCQLNRMVEGRDNKRPTLSDLRDSGAIEQDADLVLMAYREAYYLENTRCNDPAEEEKRLGRLGEVINKLELLITKNRSGPTGTLDLFADMPCNYFADAYNGGGA
jgi:replicative DNA helicase